MNYLAHLLFAQPSSDSRIGNLLGDFYHGTKLELLSPAVAAGLLGLSRAAALPDGRSFRAGRRRGRAQVPDGHRR